PGVRGTRGLRRRAAARRARDRGGRGSQLRVRRQRGPRRPAPGGGALRAVHAAAEPRGAPAGRLLDPLLAPALAQPARAAAARPARRARGGRHPALPGGGDPARFGAAPRMRPLPFVWPYAPLFWVAHVWAFWPEFRIVREGRRAATAQD